MTPLSIIVPTRRSDPGIIERARRNAARAGADELILVEPDDLPDPQPEAPCEADWRCLRATRGRGSQCARGAREARGRLLMFLHDDTDLPDSAGAALKAAFADPALGMTCFRLRFDRRHWLLGLYGALSRVESPFSTFGDQAMTLRREVYDAVGGVPEWPLFEDVELARRVRRVSRIEKLAPAVTTSAVRFTENGMLRQQIANGLLLTRFLLGGSPERLAVLYERRRVRRAAAPATAPARPAGAATEGSGR